MRIKAVAQICAESKRVILHNQKNAQWVTDGYAAYKLDGFPTVNGEELLTIFDVPEKKKGDYALTVKSEDKSIFEDVYAKERVLQTPRLKLVVGGEDMLPLRTSLGLELIPCKYVKPFDRTEITLYERETEEEIYIAVKEGLFCVAIIVPYNGGGAMLAEELDDIARGWRQSVSRRKRYGQDTEKQMQVDPETGEITEDA